MTCGAIARSKAARRIYARHIRTETQTLRLTGLQPSAEALWSTTSPHP